MKVPKSVLQSIAVAVVVSVTTSGCKKIDFDFINPDKAKLEQINTEFDCPGCGRG